MRSSVEVGLKAENYFRSIMNNKGLTYEFIDDWYDFAVNNIPVEIKSCRLSVKSRGKGYQIGRFDFTDESNREAQYKYNVWICFIIRHDDQFMLLGFCKAKKLNKKRYISIHETRDLDLISLDDWIKKIIR